MGELSTKDVGARIRAARTARKFSQEELAARVGVTQGAVFQWETGGTITLENLLRTATELGVPVGELLGDPAPATPPLSDDLLVSTLECLGDALGARLNALPPHRQAKLIAYVYRRGGTLPRDEVRSLFELMA